MGSAYWLLTIYMLWCRIGQLFNFLNLKNNPGRADLEVSESIIVISVLHLPRHPLIYFWNIPVPSLEGQYAGYSSWCYSLLLLHICIWHCCVYNSLYQTNINVSATNYPCNFKLDINKLEDEPLKLIQRILNLYTVAYVRHTLCTPILVILPNTTQI